MFRKGRVLFAIIAIIALVGTGFAAGMIAYIPIRRQISRYRHIRKSRVAEQNQIEQFLNREAPQIQTVTLDGEPWSLEGQRGRNVLLFFWATSCPYSRGAIPYMIDLFEKYSQRDDIVVTGISVDRDRDLLTYFIASKNLPWINLFEDGKGWDNSVTRAFGVRGIPSVWIIDDEGIVRGIHLKGEKVEEALMAILDDKPYMINGEKNRGTKLTSRDTPDGCTE
jgi:peroxiredoxin